MGQSYVRIHGILLKLYSDIASSDDNHDIVAELERVRELVCSSRCADSFLAYERYLDLIVLRRGACGLKDQLTLLDGAEFETALRRDPSQPFNVIGEALHRLRKGDRGRARQLLRRLAGSRYPARGMAQLLLGQLALGKIGA